MNNSGYQVTAIWPLMLYFVIVLALVTSIIGISFALGQRHMDRATGVPYESGIDSYGSARLHLSAKFYLVALFFVIFDLETVFIFAWATVVVEAGWAGYIGMLVFISVLLAALSYLWRLGALDWTSKPIRRGGQNAR